MCVFSLSQACKCGGNFVGYFTSFGGLLQVKEFIVPSRSYHFVTSKSCNCPWGSRRETRCKLRLLRSLFPKMMIMNLGISNYWRHVKICLENFFCQITPGFKLCLLLTLLPTKMSHNCWGSDISLGFFSLTLWEMFVPDVVLACLASVVTRWESVNAFCSLCFFSYKMGWNACNNSSFSYSSFFGE